MNKFSSNSVKSDGSHFKKVMQSYKVTARHEAQLIPHIKPVCARRYTRLHSEKNLPTPVVHDRGWVT